MNQSSPDIVELVTDELLAHGEFSSGANNRSNAREAARVVVDMVRSHSSAATEQYRKAKYVEQNPDSKTWTASIDALRSYPYQDEQWHLSAIEFHHKVKEEAEALRDTVLASLTLAQTSAGVEEAPISTKSLCSCNAEGRGWHATWCRAARLHRPHGAAQPSREAFEPFIRAAAGLPKSVSSAAPFARVSNDARTPGTMQTITVGEFRRLVEALCSLSSTDGGTK